MGGRFPVRFPEKLVEYLFAGGTLSEIPEYVATHFAWHRSAVTERSQCSGRHQPLAVYLKWQKACSLPDVDGRWTRLVPFLWLSVPRLSARMQAVSLYL